MKTLIATLCMAFAGSVLLAPQQADAATYPAHSCMSKDETKPLDYIAYSAQTRHVGGTLIACSPARIKDSGTARADAVIYFTDDGRTKFCTFENYDINTGRAGIWTSANGVRRIAFPSLASTLRWYPFSIQCLMPQFSVVTGFAVLE
jgi:hypothetical protein